MHKAASLHAGYTKLQRQSSRVQGPFPVEEPDEKHAGAFKAHESPFSRMRPTSVDDFYREVTVANVVAHLDHIDYLISCKQAEKRKIPISV